MWEEHPLLDNIPEYLNDIPEWTNDIPAWTNDNFFIPQNENYVEVEKRVDPFDNKWYTKDEFIEYYGCSIFWDMLCPKKVFRRTMLENMISRTKESLTDININYLLDKMIETFT